MQNEQGRTGDTYRPLSDNKLHAIHIYLRTNNKNREEFYQDEENSRHNSL